jgi:hypothetical protein
MNAELEKELIGILEKTCHCKKGVFIDPILEALIPFIEKCENEQCCRCIGRAD